MAQFVRALAGWGRRLVPCLGPRFNPSQSRYTCHFHLNNLRGPPLDIWGRPGHFYLFHKRFRLKALIEILIESFHFFHLRIGCKYYFNIYIIFISTSCVCKICISTISCGHLFISPISPTKIFISKNSTPSIQMVAPLKTLCA